MSYRTLVELNHDFRPKDSVTASWGEAFQRYMRAGDKDQLPSGVTFIQMHHHSEPSIVESLQQQLDAANQRAADAWAQVEAIAVNGLGLPEVDESDEIPPEWNSSGTLSELVRNWKDRAEAAERKLATVHDGLIEMMADCLTGAAENIPERIVKALAQIEQPQSSPTTAIDPIPGETK